MPKRSNSNAQWKSVALGDDAYFKLIMGQSPPSITYNDSGVGLPFYQGKAEFGEMFPTPSKYCTEPNRIAEKDDVLISVRAPVGPTNIAETRCCIGRGLAAVRCKWKVLPRFLFYALRTIEGDIADSVKDQGGGFTAIRRDQLEAFEIPIPPLDEQCRIVGRIEELRKRVTEASALQGEAINEVETILQSAVDRIFSRGSGLNWSAATISQLCGKPQYGYTESATVEPIGPRFLRITDIQNGLVDWDEVPFCRCDNPDKYLLKNGDILFARTGATTGKSFIVDEPPIAIFASYLIRISPKKILPKFLWWYFQSSSYWATVKSGIDDGNRPNMNGTKLAQMQVPFPQSHPEQVSIVKKLDELAERTRSLKSEMQATQMEMGQFNSALLSKAFCGEL